MDRRPERRAPDDASARMIIRPYQPDDLPVLRNIAVEAFDGVSIDQGIEREFGPINGRDWRWRKGRHIDDDARRAADGIFVAVDETTGTIYGFVTSWHDEEAGLGHIPNISIAAGHRGRGIGRRLLEHVLQDFRRRGLSHAKIETLTQNDVGYGLYTSLGFREVARQIHLAMDLNAPAPAEPSPSSPQES